MCLEINFPRAFECLYDSLTSSIRAARFSRSSPTPREREALTAKHDAPHRAVLSIRRSLRRCFLLFGYRKKMNAHGWGMRKAHSGLRGKYRTGKPVLGLRMRGLKLWPACRSFSPWTNSDSPRRLSAHACYSLASLPVMQGNHPSCMDGAHACLLSSDD